MPSFFINSRSYMVTQSWKCFLNFLVVGKYNMFKFNIICNADFFAEELTEQGLISETATGGAICNICGYASDIYNDVRRHLEGKHSIGRGYPCPLCGFKSKTESTRRKHVLNVHKKIFSTTELRLMAEKGVPNT